GLRLMRVESRSAHHRLLQMIAAATFCVSSIVLVAAHSPATRAHRAVQASSVRSFDSPEQAADALITAAESFDVPALQDLFGPEARDTVLSGEYAQDRKRAADFVEKAHEKSRVSLDSGFSTRATLFVGSEDWPFPIPIVKRGSRWSFDAKEGRQE